LNRVENQSDPFQVLSDTKLEMLNLSKQMQQILFELEEGVGIVMIRGLNQYDFTRHQQKIIFWILGGLLGDYVIQNNTGELLCEVSNRKDTTSPDTKIRGYQTNEALRFHTDSADFVGLLCEEVSAEGGLSRVASSIAVHNILLSEYREYLGVLYNGFLCLKGNPSDAEKQVLYRNPVFCYFQNQLMCRYNRGFVESSHRTLSLSLSKVERDAMDLFESIASRPEMYIEIEFKPGDIQFLNNNALIHARTAFAGGEENGPKRKLWRLWVNSKKRKVLPSDFALHRSGFVGSEPRRAMTDDTNSTPSGS
jgi:hypothetical protein